MLISSSSRYSIYKVQCFARAPLSRLACLYYHTRSCLSRTFFKFFQTFSFALVVCVARSNFAMLSHPTPFVKHFFNFFQISLPNVSLAPFLADSLHILALPTPFVKYFFHLFHFDFSGPVDGVFCFCMAGSLVFF